MEDFPKLTKREPRYVVFKIKDMDKYLTQGEKEGLLCVGEEIQVCRANDGKPPLNAVVVEQDWPEFEVVWEMIEARMTGQKSRIDRMNQLAVAIESDPTEPGHRRELARMCLTTTSSYDERRPTIKPQAKGD